MSGKLYVVPTPIGNLQDITYRCIETLRSVDVIACEDTRNTLKLTNHYEIDTRLTSFHEHNKMSKLPKLIESLLNGEDAALVSDAGMPGIADPGFELINSCHQNGIEVIVLPGPCALVNALVFSGLDNKGFVFLGFIPFKSKERKEVLESIAQETKTIIIYEAPHKLVNTLTDLQQYLGATRRIVLCKELTKLHEKRIDTTIEKALELYNNEPPKGEYVIVIEGIDKKLLQDNEIKKWENVTIEEHMKIYDKMPRNEAMKMVAKDRGLKKSDIYNYLIKEKDND